MLKTNVILLTSAIFAFCNSAAIIEKVNKKCAAGDADCQKELYGTILKEIADNGLPDLDVPKIDPFVVKNMEFSALGMINITTVDGAVTGFKTCKINSYKTDIENQRVTSELMCDRFAIEGVYKIKSTPTLLALAGGIKVHGEGKGSVVIEKLKLDLDFAYEVQKHDDGELHFHIKPDESTNTFEILEKATFAADNILIGKQEISTVAVNIFNENWEIVTKTFGKFIIDIGLQVFYENVEKFFNHIPINDLLTDDLSSYVKS